MSVPRSTWRDSLGLAAAVGAYGVAFGVAGVASGIGVLQTCLYSLVVFTGASQFAAVGVIAAGGGVASAVGSAVLLASRNALYAMQLSPLLKVRGLRRLAAAQVTIDESTGMALVQAPNGPEAMRGGFWITGLGVFFFWNVCTFAGALGAHALGDPSRWGLDAAVPAAFLALVWPRLTSGFLRVVAASAVVFAVLATPVLPAGVPVVASGLLAVVFGWGPR